MSGQAIRERPADVGRVRTAGHALGSHGETHEPFPDLTRAELDSELDAVDALVRRRTGERPDILRPPFGETDAAVAEAAAEHGQAQIVWDTDSEDWTGIGAEEIAANVAAVTPPGGLVLLHGTRDTTVAALPEILDRAESHGLTLVTVPDLLGDTEPGAVYYTADRRPTRSASAWTAARGDTDGAGPQPLGQALAVRTPPRPARGEGSASVGGRRVGPTAWATEL